MIVTTNSRPYLRGAAHMLLALLPVQDEIRSIETIEGDKGNQILYQFTFESLESADRAFDLLEAADIGADRPLGDEPRIIVLFQ